MGLEIFDKIPEYQQKLKNVIDVIADKNYILPVINYTGGFVEQHVVDEERFIKNKLMLNSLDNIFQEAEA